MPRKLLLLASLLTVAEFAFLALLLRTFLAGEVSGVGAAMLSLAPNAFMLLGPWTLFATRWAGRGGVEAAPEAVREEMIQLPRRVLFVRMGATTLVTLALVPFAARRAHLPPGAEGVLAGLTLAIAFAFNNLRSLAYRAVIDAAAPRYYASDALRYQARTLRERLFVSANTLGIVGTGAAAVFSYFVLEAPLTEFAETSAKFPALVAVLATGFAVDVFRSSRGLVAWAARAPNASVERAFTSSASLPYRLAASNLLCWTIAAAAMAITHWNHGALSGAVMQVFAGIVSVGCGTVMYQAVWHQRIVNPLQERSAAELVERQTAIPRGRLSIRSQLLIVFLLLLGFGGAFAFATLDAEHQRVVSGDAAQRAGEELDGVIAHAAADDLAHPARLRGRPDSRSEVFEVDEQGSWVGVDRDLPDAVLDRVRAHEVGFAGIPGAHASVAWRRVGAITLGVIYPWRDGAQNSLGEASTLYVFVVLLLAAVGLIWLFSNELAGPIRELEQHARRLGRGELDQPIPAGSADEVGSLADALETSRRSLKQTLSEIRALNASLEQRVKDRTSELERTNLELARALQAVAAAQEAVVGAEKLASLGRMSAGIAHEVNNPLNFVKNALPPLRRSIAELREAHQRGTPAETDAVLAEMQEVVQVMVNGVTRMSTILRALLDFSRHAPDGRPELFDLRQAIDSALALVHHEMAGRVTVAVELEGIDQIVGEPGPLGQVLMNLVKNSAEAIQGPGTIDIRARRIDDAVEISVRDSGGGMPPEVVQRAFEPFFTTKPVGKGTGLGLSTVHGIVQKHGGATRISSTSGAGTTVTIVLPQRTTSSASQTPAERPQSLGR